MVFFFITKSTHLEVIVVCHCFAHAPHLRTFDNFRTKGSSVVLNPSSTINSHVAARVGFIVLGHVADETQIDTLTGDTYTVPTDAKAVIWEPNSAIHVDKAGAIDNTNTQAQSYFGVSGASSTAFVANADGDYTDTASITVTAAP